MRTFILVNDVAAVTADQSTLLLGVKAVARGHEVYGCSVASMSYTAQKGIVLHARRLGAESDLDAVVQGLRGGEEREFVLSEGDLLMLRTNPARDKERSWAHEMAIAFARLARDQGVHVVNDPDGLHRASSKLYVMGIPEAYRPRTIVTRDVEQILAFIEAESGPTVLKPLQGTHGRDVFKIEKGHPHNLLQIIEVLTRDGYAMVQSYLPEAGEGDVRVLLAGGEILEQGGHAAAVRRVPHARDFRSNVHAGGRAVPATVTDAMREAVKAIGPRLRDDGIVCAGLDFIGSRVVEINVYSPGGFGHAELYTGVDFADLLLERIESWVGMG